MEEIYKEIKRLRSLLFFFSLLFVSFYIHSVYINVKQNERLNAHKEVIIKLKEQNDHQTEMIELLYKNQILINNKLNRNERDRG